ncbi:MAG TPA: tyrosine-type recombinase/integrase [Kiritimatiellia bacterium]|nr:tyrosine-type recombinase/integrase [Kiritimatiellia bacterium]
MQLCCYSNWAEFWSVAKKNLQKSGYKHASLIFYWRILKMFVRTVNKLPAEITRDDVRQYLIQLGRPNCTWHWTGMNISVVRTFFDKLSGMNLLWDVRGPRRKKTLPEIVTRQQIEKIMDHAQTVRNKLVIGLLYGCGLKTFELQKLCWSDFDFDRKTLNIRSRYSEKIRVLHLPKTIIEIMLEWRVIQGSEDLVFPGETTGKPLTARAIQLIVRHGSDSAGIKSKNQNQHITPAILRHSFAVHFLEDGGNIRELQEAMDIQTVEAAVIYLECLELLRMSSEAPTSIALFTSQNGNPGQRKSEATSKTSDYLRHPFRILRSLLNGS